MLNQIIISISITLVTSFIISYLLVRFLPRKNNQPPNYGGIALFISIWLAFFIMFPSLLFTSAQWWLFIASFLVFITGIIDDYFELKAWQKTLGILLAANLVYFKADIEFSSILIANVSPWLFDLISYFLTIFWIFFVTNALNLLDGMDGLVCGVSLTSLIALIIMTFLASLSIRLTFIMLLFLLAAAILGFLPFNWYPAKIYLGDTGALFIGFMFATLTVYNLKNVSFFSLIVPILFYAVPLFDTLYAIFRRLLKGQSVVEKDHDHVHHRLLRLGLSEVQIVIIMIAITGLFSLFAILTSVYRNLRWIILILSILFLILFTVFMRRMDSKE